MHQLLRGRPSQAMIVACFALLVALGGTSGAAVSSVPNNSVGTSQLKNNAVTSAKIKDAQVTSADIAGGAVTSAKIKDAQVTSADIANGTITAADVKNGSLLEEDFKSGQLPAGPPGPRGPKGAQGPPGISALERKDVSSPSSGADSKTVVAVCPSGKRVVGGGARVTGSGAGKVSIVESFPDSDGDKWNAVAREVTATGAAWQLTSYALCATVAQ